MSQLHTMSNSPSRFSPNAPVTPNIGSVPQPLMPYPGQYLNTPVPSPGQIYKNQSSPNVSLGNNYGSEMTGSPFNAAANSGNVLSNPSFAPQIPKQQGTPYLQNGLYSSSVTHENKNPSQVSNITMNGLSSSHSELQAPIPSPMSSQLRVHPPTENSELLAKISNSGYCSATGISAQRSLWQPGDPKTVPVMTSVPSTGLPLPYNSKNAATSSPQITPGPSRPSNSSSNLQNTSTSSPFSQSISQYPAGYGSSVSTNSNFPVTGHLAPALQLPAQPFPNVSPGSLQNISSAAPVPSPARPKYPQGVGYSQSNQSPNLITTQPRNLPPPSSIYNSSPQSQLLAHPMQTGIPDGPVGGVSGYDPQLHAKMAGMSVHSSFSRLWGNDTINLLQDRNVLPSLPLEPPKPVVDKPNCSPSIFRCTLTKIPESSSLLQKSRLPFGILIHPFREAYNLPVIQCNSIVRCRNCRTYINPFVTFADLRRWKCNLCFRINDLPEEFLYDPVTRAYGDPSRRLELKNATLEFIAPSDYMLRPPQPAAYLFLLDVSHGACEIGYLKNFCDILIDHLDHLPGDARTRIGFMTFDGSLHFYNLAEGLNQPHMLVVSDVDDVFLPTPDNLLVNLQESKLLIRDLLEDIPKKFANNADTNCCLGAALQAAYKLMSPIGGRVTVIQTCLANFGPGALKNREDPNQRAAKDITNVGPAMDFYKKLALECSGQQVAVDLFLLCSQYVDIATISCISKYSSGCVHYYPGYHHKLCKIQVNKFSADLKRYLERKIGFEAVMRIRCTRGLAIHAFHGNFFVRSTDLLSLPNVNPDVGFGMQIAIEENLTDCSSVCFQAAVLYTSSNGERRIRVHTLSLPVVSILQDVWGGADQEAIIGLVSKMAVDRSVTSSLSDARDALINVCIDLLGAYKMTVQSGQTGSLMTPYSTRLVPLFILGLLKHVAFRTGVSTKLDERVYAMECMKTLPLSYIIRYIYPTLYPVHSLDDKNAIHQDDDIIIPQPPILQLCSEKIDRHGVYLLDTFDILYLFVGRAVSDHFCTNVLGFPNFQAIPDGLSYLPELRTPESERLRNFISWLQSQRPYQYPLMLIREDSNARQIFLEYMVDDRTESLFSYYEFLQHLRQQISK